MLRKEVPEVWVSRINDYKVGKERPAVWCERNQVTQHQLYYWMEKLRRQQALAASRPQFIPVCLDESVAGATNEAHQAERRVGEASPLVIRMALATVEVGPGFDASLLGEVIRGLKGLC